MTLVLLVAGTRGDKPATLALRQFAVYIANLFFLTSDALATVVKDDDVDGEAAERHNLIIVGSPVENSWAGKYHERTPLKLLNGKLTLGELVCANDVKTKTLSPALITFHSQVKKSRFSQPHQEKCISEVVRIGSIVILHLSKL